MKKTSRGCDGYRLTGIQRIKPDTGVSTGIVHIGPDIQLQKIGDPWNRGKIPQVNVPHEEGNNTDIGNSRECIDFQSWRQGSLYFGNIPFPMQKEQLPPILVHNGPKPVRTLTCGEPVLYGRVSCFIHSVEA
jgi:hypothetical protein